MKYSELEKKLKELGCYDTGEQMNGHPVWYSPITERKFKMSNHKSQEVKKGTLSGIKKQSGLK
ncbi:type II toxin-antitoxin system HicA family toxin [Capnocytophaga canis]|uniref:type II toxin-antitoxin system HicA family toxin n=1 Tax=Capnocytophaga canis TaxID=1848903 RepID=UPI0005A8BC51|nr:type II toxin-antitoxin system HicA family toxin [Capnocytophaga canis]